MIGADATPSAPVAVRKVRDRYALRFERRLEEPPGRVWTMLTDPAEVARWRVPIEIERHGGGWLIEHPPGEEEPVACRILRYDPPHLLETTWTDATRRPGVTVKWEIQPVGRGSRLLLTHTLARGVTDSPGAAEGWASTLDALERALRSEALPALLPA